MKIERRNFTSSFKARMARYLSLLVLTGAVVAGGAEPSPAGIQVPPGFEVTLVAAPPLIGYPMLGAFDDRGRLFIAENAGVNLNRAGLMEQLPSRIRMLEDTDGDGVFDRSTVFADKMTFPQGVQWFDGALYVASPPSIWRLEDVDGDGHADKRQEIVTGFKYDGNAADVHGPFLHPNGRLYWTHGRKGHEVYQHDGTLVSKALGARIWSCRPDGSDIQVYAGGGMDNPVELTFNQEGDIFGTVNYFQANPRSDAVVHWVNGGVYPRADLERVLNEFKRTGDLLSPISYLGHVAPAGITLMRNEGWGGEYRDNLFFAEFNTHRIMRLSLQQVGSTYRGLPQVFASSANTGMHFTDVIEDADGSLLVIDTGAWFRIGCPTSGVAHPDILGGIYRIRKVGAPIIKDPRGLAIQWNRLPSAALIDYLADQRPAVRERAISELVRLSDAAVPELAVALSDKRYLARSNAVWALTRIGTSSAQTAIRPTLRDGDPRVRQAAAQSVCATGDKEVSAALIHLLGDESAPVAREAARALGHLKDVMAVQPLALAAVRKDADPVLTHALIYALIEIDDVAATRKLQQHEQPLVRRAALLALDQMPDASLSPDTVFLALRSSDAALRAAALSIAVKHRAWGDYVARYLADAFLRKPDDATLMASLRLLDAFIGATEVRAWLGVQMSAGDKSFLPLKNALEAIAAATEAWDESWRASIVGALRLGNPTIAEAGLKAAAAHRERDFSDVLRAVARDGTRPTAFRVAALQVAAGDNELDEESFRLLVQPLKSGGSPESRQQAAAVLAGAKLSREQLMRLVSLVPSVTPAELPRLLGAFHHGPADASIAAALLTELKQTPARWALIGGDLQALFRRYPPPTLEDAAPMISEILNQTVAKDSRITELEKLTQDGDAVRGRRAFLAGSGACICINCHRVDENGGKIGPDLSHIGRIRETRDILESIAFPSATLARGYETFSVQTKSGETLMGTIPRETADALIMALGDGREISIARASIAKMEPIPTSLMPQGLDRAMDKQTLSDLVAFLKSLK